MARKPKKFSAQTEVRAIARERIGAVRAAKIITPKNERKPKHKKDPLAEDSGRKR
jgi:hypothetical protein